MDRQKTPSGESNRRMATVLACCTFAVAAMADSADAEPLGGDGCIDRLYEESHLVGHPPEHPAWSRSGERLAFIWDQTGGTAGEIWVYETASGQKRKVSDFASRAESAPVEALQWLDERRLVFLMAGSVQFIELQGQGGEIPTSGGAVKGIAAAPDGSYIAYAAEQGVWVRPMSEATQPIQVFALNGERTSVESIKWSADSEALAFVVADDSSTRQIEIPYSANGEARVHRVVRPFPGDATTRRRIGLFEIPEERLTWVDRRDPEDLLWHYEWAGGKKSLLIDSSDFLARARDVTVYDVEARSSESYYSSSGPHGGYRPYWSASWAPDDRGLIILSDHEGFYHLYFQDRAGEALQPLSGGTWEVASFDVDRRHGYVYFLANKDHIADRQMYRVSLGQPGMVENISDAAGTYVPVYSPTFEDVAFSFSDDSTPPDLYHKQLRSSPSSETHRVTHSSRTLFEQFDWADVEYLEFNSHVDNATLYGRLYRPPDFRAGKRYPLIVGSVYSDTVRNQWGGRSVHPTWGLDQCLVAGGYLVLNVNVRGSWGQGRAFRQALEEFGSIDVEDIESGVRYLIAKGYVDGRRVGIWGSSYGGLLTTMSLFKKPGVYAAGIAGAPATNVWHAFPGEMRVMGEPSGDDYPARYRRQSSLYHARGLQDPLMIIHGTKDDVVLYSDSIALAERFIADGSSFEVVTLPGIGHPWDNEDLATTRFAFRKMIEFFDRHLGD